MSEISVPAKRAAEAIDRHETPSGKNRIARYVQDAIDEATAGMNGVIQEQRAEIERLRATVSCGTSGGCRCHPGLDDSNYSFLTE